MKKELHSSPTRNVDHVFLLGRDYHLGDLLWFTAVLAEYRRQMNPRRVVVGLPDRPISRILEHNPHIDHLMYGVADAIVAQSRREANAVNVIPEINDLRPMAVAKAMVRDWRFHLPWLYYRELWLEPRGQWLATFLRLGTMREFRPILKLCEDDVRAAGSLPARYVVLAPHVGHYPFPLSSFWRRIKGWPLANWVALATALRQEGFEAITLGAQGQTPVEGTIPMMGLPIRQAAGIIDRAAALISAESGLWFIAAARGTPFVIVPWWLPRSVSWPAPMRVPHRLVYRDAASLPTVLSSVRDLVSDATE